jgi:predicted transcriptional regulator
MTIELSRETEAHVKEAAQAKGVSVDQYIQALIAETSLRHRQISEFRAAIAERVASLNDGECADGEEVMSRLVADLR